MAAAGVVKDIYLNLFFFFFFFFFFHQSEKNTKKKRRIKQLFSYFNSLIFSVFFHLLPPAFFFYIYIFDTNQTFLSQRGSPRRHQINTHRQPPTPQQTYYYSLFILKLQAQHRQRVLYLGLWRIVLYGIYQSGVPTPTCPALVRCFPSPPTFLLRPKILSCKI